MLARPDRCRAPLQLDGRLNCRASMAGIRRFSAPCSPGPRPLLSRHVDGHAKAAETTRGYLAVAIAGEPMGHHAAALRELPPRKSTRSVPASGPCGSETGEFA